MHAPNPTLTHPTVPPSFRRTQARGPLPAATLAAMRAMFEPPAETHDELDAAVERVMAVVRAGRSRA